MSNPTFFSNGQIIAIFQAVAKIQCSSEMLMIFANDGATASRISLSKDVGIASLSQLLVGIPLMIHPPSSGDTDQN